MSKNVLFVAVHPDDETLGCGGTILKHKYNGDNIYWLILTSIENHPNRYPDFMVNKRQQTISRVASVYGFNNVYEMKFPTILLDKFPLIELVQKLDAVVCEIKPNVVYLPNSNDVHSDHRVAFSALYSCLKSFRKPYIEQVLMMEILSETEFAPALPSTSFIPNVFVDITDFIDKKLEIMSMYDTEIMDEPFPRSISSIEALARTRGSRAGVKYAEAYMLLYLKI